MSEYDDDLDPNFSPRQRHGLWGGPGWAIALVGIVGIIVSMLFVFDDDAVGKVIGIIACIISVGVAVYGVSHMVRHRKPHYRR